MNPESNDIRQDEAMRKLIAGMPPDAVADPQRQSLRHAWNAVRRAETRRRRRESKYAGQQNREADPPDVSAAKMEEYALLWQAVNSLPPRQNKAVRLCYFDNRSQKQASREMRVSLRKIKYLLSCAKRSLEKVLPKGFSDYAVPRPKRQRTQKRARRPK